MTSLPDRFTPKLWLGYIALLILSLLLLFVLRQGLAVESDILSLLPATEQDAVAEQAVSQIDQTLSRKHLLLVGASTMEDAVLAADRLAAGLTQLPGIADIDYRIDQQAQRAMIEPYQQHARTLLDETSRQQLATGNVGELLQSSLKLLYTPVSPISSAMLELDPLLLFYRYALSIKPEAGKISLENGVLHTRFLDRYYILISVDLVDSPFSVQLQKQLLPPMQQLVDEVQTAFDADILSVGALRYAAAGVASAQQEIMTIGVGSLLAVIIILLCVFRSPIPLFASLLPIGTGFCAAFLACQWLFGSVHLLTLVFGASLIGISIDYSFHYFCDRLGGDAAWTGRAGVRRIFPGISLGLLTSVLGYIGLCFAPFPAMQQIAVFSTVGLFSAFLTVACIFPVIASRSAANANVAAARISFADKTLQRLRASSRRKTILCLILLVFAGTGIAQLQSNDDIRLLQHAPDHLKSEELRAQEILGSSISNHFLMIEGESAEQVLKREEALRSALDHLVETGKLSRFDSLSSRLPSMQRQYENAKLLQTAFSKSSSEFQHYADSLSLDPTLLQPLTNSYKQLLSLQQEELATLAPQILEKHFLTHDEWMDSAAAEPWRHLWIGATERGFASAIALYGGDKLALRQLEQEFTHVSWINRTDDISNLLGQYRQRAAMIVAASYALIYVLLSFRYGILRALRAMLPPAIAIMLALGALGWLNSPLNIFHLLALLLVLGIGVDYTLFLEEGASHQQTTMLAILLSAMTTLISFGLLAVSQTPAVNAFGIVVLLGISSSTLLAPLFCAQEIEK